MFFFLYSFAVGLCIVQHIVRMTNGDPLTRCCSWFQVAKAVSHSLNNCVNCLPGQKDVDMALRSIGEASKKLLVDIVSQTFTWGFLVLCSHLCKKISKKYHPIIEQVIST